MSEPAPSCALLYCHSWLPAQVDGVAVRMMAHAQALKERGCRVVVITPDFVVRGNKLETPKLNVIPDIEHVTVATQLTPVYRKNLCMDLSWANIKRIVDVIRRVKPDIIHGTQEASLQVLVTACLLCDAPLVISMHTDVSQIAERDEGFSNFFSGRLGRLHAKAAVSIGNVGYKNWERAGSTFFCVSKQAKSILQVACIAESKVVPETWGPMVDRNVFRIDLPEDQVREVRESLTFGIPDAYLLVYVGRITAEKDIQFLIDAMSRAPTRVVFALIGTGSMVPELKRLHGVEHRIHCSGDLRNRDQVALSLRAADCCVSASTMETVGFTAFESLSCGTPMFAANAQGFAEHLSHGVNARLWTPHDPDSFDQELALLLATKREGCWTSEALRASVESASLESCTNRALRAYARAQRADNRLQRVIVTLFWFFLNWICSFFIK